MDFIGAQASAHPELTEAYNTLGELHEKKLWHQLTLALESFLSNPNNVRGSNFLSLYEGFIASFEARLNQVKLTGLISLICRTLPPADALQFVTKVLNSRNRLGVEASLCLDMEIVILKLKLGDVDSAKDMLESAKETVNTINSAESVIFSKYYRAVAEYRKIAGPASEFYSAALMFLSYTAVEELQPDDRYTLATDMALASVTGETIFNFGEVLSTPILSYLQNTPNEWLLRLVEAMNSGNVEQFNQVVQSYREAYFAQPALAASHEKVVKEKIILLCLVNIAFQRNPHDRVIRFQDIADRAGIHFDQVEWMLMRAMSVGLLRGTIDEVEGTVSVTWVQPRVLNVAQIQQLNDQLGVWVEKTKNALLTIEDQAAELF